MAKTRLEDKFTEALMTRGHRYKGYTRNRRYQILTGDAPDTFYFIGRAGAVRIGRTVTESEACTQAFKDQLLADYDAIKRADRLQK